MERDDLPQDILPRDFIYEERKCPRCRKVKQYLKNDKRVYCETCREYARSYKHAHKVFKLSKADKALMEEDARRKTKELESKYGTKEHDCLTWRNQYSHGQRSDFTYNHLYSCLSCARWFALHKNDSLDINKGMDEVKDELQGYAETFKTPEPYKEDYMYSPYGTFPMNRICPSCGHSLTARGTCPICEPSPDD